VPGPPEFYDSCDEQLAHMVTWSRYRGVVYATFVLKASFALRNGRTAALLPPQLIRWCDLPRASGALDRADESAPFTGGGAVLVHGFLYASGATQRDPVIARVMVGTDKPVVDKIIAAEQSGRIPLAWEHALRTLDNPVGAEQPILVDPRDLSKSIGLGPIAPGWPTRANLLFAPINVRDQILEIPERIDSRFFNPAPRDQQCPPFRGTEAIVLQNLVPGLPELRSWLPGISIASKASIDNVPVQAIFFLDTITIDAEVSQAHVVWRAVTPLPPTVRQVVLEATLQGSLEPYVPEAEAPVSVAPETAPAPIEVPVVKPPRVLPAEPRQLEKLDNPRRTLMERAKAGASLENLDLEGADLQGLDLSGRSLAGSKLDGANLRSANLRGANLWATSLVGADLGGAALDGADLEAANLTKVRAQKATFVRAMLISANLSKARFDSATLDDADLSDATATGVAFVEAKLRRAKLNRAKLEGALLVSTDFTDAWLDFAILTKCSMDEARFGGASMTDVELTQSVADRASFERARLARAKLRQVRLTGAAMSGVDLSHAVLENADMTDAHLEGAMLDGVSARSAKLVRANLTGATMRGADLAGADLTGARLTKVDRSTANLQGAKLAGVVE